MSGHVDSAEVERSRAVPILEVWERLGFDAPKRDGALVKSPWRADGNASLQVGGGKNVVHDYGTNETLDTLALIRKARPGMSFREAVSFALGRAPNDEGETRRRLAPRPSSNGGTSKVWKTESAAREAFDRLVVARDDDEARRLFLDGYGLVRESIPAGWRVGAYPGQGRGIVYQGQTPDGRPVFKWKGFARVDGKRQSRFMFGDGGGALVLSADPSAPWVVVGGEEKALAVASVGHNVLASLTGEKALSGEWAAWLVARNPTRVVLGNDADEAGAKANLETARALREAGLAPDRIAIVEWSETAPEGHDLNDVLKDDGLEGLRDVLESAPPWNDSEAPSVELSVRIESAISGEYATVSWPWSTLGRLTRALLPGTLTLLCGDPGATKSFMLLQALAFWIREGVRAALFAVEEDKAFHLQRALAQMEGRADLTDPAFVRRWPAIARDGLAKHREALDAVGAAIWTAPVARVDLDGMARWIETRAKEGFRIVAVDPITAAERRGDAWEVDARFVCDAKKIAVENGSSIVLVTHPVKLARKGAPSLFDLAGGSAYSRLSQTILFLEALRPAKAVNVIPEGGGPGLEVLANRRLTILKSRNGVGGGMTIAFNFDSETLRLQELGAVIGK